VAGVTGRLLTLEEAAERLGCSVKTVRRRVAAGELPTFRSGRLIRVRDEDLRRYVAQRTMRTSSATRASAAAGGRKPAAKLWEPV
jgi:excisionase family DNA binding protein